jgi:EAL domain-containing protein (putative c-di-GMP-specific phosphodiesterase class I)/ActR/RegA family two-component response regulator
MSPSVVESTFVAADPPLPDASMQRSMEISREIDPASRRLQPNILLVDDDPFMLGMQSRMLRSLGYRNVSTAASGEAALLKLKQAHPAFDLILCDLNMPGMDGIEFLQILNASHLWGSIILVSGEGARIMHSVQKLLHAGRLVILGALEKPVDRNALRRLLDSWQPLKPQQDKTPSRILSIADLHAATRESQWVLHYQPKVDLKTGALAGVEALVRCNHPVYGLIYPDSFIGMAEDHGAIDGLTGWVMQETLRQLSLWRSEGEAVKVAVNISMESLSAPKFSGWMKALFRDSWVSPQDVTLEITESRLISGSPTPLENLVRLRMLGFRLSVDDFGTGHSSLAQLRDVPFTELKVDRGFVSGARHNQFIRPILEGSIDIARRLGVQSVAEGVETEDEWHLLREVGCGLAQGYFIGRPMPGDRLKAWLQQWESRQASLTGG